MSLSEDGLITILPSEKDFTSTLSILAKSGFPDLTAVFAGLLWQFFKSESSETQVSVFLKTPQGDSLLLCLVAQSCPTFCDSMDCNPPGSSVHGDSPGKNTGVGCHALLQGIFLTQGSNLRLLYFRQILYWLNRRGSSQGENHCLSLFFQSRTLVLHNDFI